MEIDCGDHIIVFDAGTGLRALGQSLMARSPVRGDLLFSHTNLNRICGLPFFAAAFHPKNTFGFWCGHEPEEGSIKDVLTHLMTDPVFPVPIGIFNADLSFHDFTAGEALSFDEVAIDTMPVTCGLPGTAYRVRCPIATISYVCGVKPGMDVHDIVEFVQGSDLLILSLVEEEITGADKLAVQIARETGVGCLYLTDHAPGESDEALIRREHALMKASPVCRLAREGQTIEFSD